MSTINHIIDVYRFTKANENCSYSLDNIYPQRYWLPAFFFPQGQFVISKRKRIYQTLNKLLSSIDNILLK